VSSPGIAREEHQGVYARLRGLSSEQSAAPRRIEDVPPAYVTQLALYRAVLAQLYSGKTIRTLLVWTEVPDLMEISASSLDAALSAVTSA